MAVSLPVYGVRPFTIESKGIWYFVNGVVMRYHLSFTVTSLPEAVFLAVSMVAVE